MKYSKLSLIITLAFISIVKLSAQSDTINYYQSNDTCVATTVNEYDKLLKYFIADKTEINQLYKVDLFQLALGRFNFAYEQRLTQNQSLELSTEFSQMYNYNTPQSYYSPFDLSNSNMQIQYLSIEADYRIYTNINRRLKNGKNTNGFSANYFTLGFASHSWFYNKDVYMIDWDGRLLPINSQSPTNESASLLFKFGKYLPNENLLMIKAGYGLQRRIGNIGYLDAQVKLGVGSNYSFSRLYIMPEVNIKIGFAISSLKRKH